MTSPSDDDELLTEYYRESAEPMQHKDLPDWDWLWGPNKAKNMASCENADQESVSHSYEYCVTRKKIDKESYIVYKCRVCERLKYTLIS